MSEYRLFQEQIFKKLRNGSGGISKQDFFNKVINQAAKSIAAKKNSSIVLSPGRLWEVQELWDGDLRSLIDGDKIENSRLPCEYKHAAFLTYWLRRRVVVESKAPINTDINVVCEDFNKYTNEYLALAIGIKLVLYHHYVPSGSSSEQTISSLEAIELPAELLKEAVVYLHHKNVSPHAVYLFFKALLVKMPPPRTPDSSISLVTAD
ncbi:hypothetical protein [Litoreibacter halocynthiae]|uniref:hypothetical protein n=1 Tax=Litoreibacter halocynthiae TaxID=1242689 RepID=UPI002491E29C|nr:hypothetical protein [Litoreibacter halocynthiae]